MNILGFARADLSEAPESFLGLDSHKVWQYAKKKPHPKTHGKGYNHLLFMASVERRKH